MMNPEVVRDLRKLAKSEHVIRCLRCKEYIRLAIEEFGEGGLARATAVVLGHIAEVPDGRAVACTRPMCLKHDEISSALARSIINITRGLLFMDCSPLTQLAIVRLHDSEHRTATRSRWFHSPGEIHIRLQPEGAKIHLVGNPGYLSAAEFFRATLRGIEGDPEKPTPHWSRNPELAWRSLGDFERQRLPEIAEKCDEIYTLLKTTAELELSFDSK